MLSRLSIPVRLLLLIAVPLAALMIVGLAGLASINATTATTLDLQARLAQQVALEKMRDSVRADLLGAMNGVAISKLNPTQGLRQLTAARDAYRVAADAYVAAMPPERRERASQRVKPIVDALGGVSSEFENALMDDNVASVRTSVMGAGGAALQGVIEEIDTLLASERAASGRL